MELPPALAAVVARGARLVRPLSAAERGIERRSLDELCQRALADPIGSPDVASMVGSRSRVAIVVSDATRDEPRAAMFAAVRERLAHLQDGAFTMVIASGTHAPRAPETALDPSLIRRFAVVVHDGSDLSACVDVGTTPEGTRVRPRD